MKTDKIDAEVLGQLLRCEYLSAALTADAATRRLRQLTTLRGGVIADRSRLKHRVQSVLSLLLVVPPVKVLFTTRRLTWLRAVELPAEVRSAVDPSSRGRSEGRRRRSNATSTWTARVRPAGWRAAVGSPFFIPWPDSTSNRELGRGPNEGPAFSRHAA